MVVARFLTFKNTFHIGKKQRSFPPSSYNNFCVLHEASLLTLFPGESQYLTANTCRGVDGQSQPKGVLLRGGMSTFRTHFISGLGRFPGGGEY